MNRVVPFLLILIALTASAEKQPFERYQSIVDRQMFGPVPPGFDPAKLPSEVQKSSISEKELTQEQAKLQSAVHFSVLDVRPNGDVVVGFTDNSDPKVPRNYFLKVGDSRDGWTVKEADPDAATMTIVKDEIEVSLSLGGNSAKGAGTTSRAGVSAAPAAGNAPVRPSLFGGSMGGSLMSRRQARRQALLQQEQEQKAKEAAEAQQREAERQQREEAERAQREAERAEQKQQLLAIQEELKRVREAKEKQTDEAESQNGDPDSGEEN